MVQVVCERLGATYQPALASGLPTTQLQQGISRCVCCLQVYLLPVDYKH